VSTARPALDWSLVEGVEQLPHVSVRAGHQVAVSIIFTLVPIRRASVKMSRTCEARRIGRWLADTSFATSPGVGAAPAAADAVADDQLSVRVRER
jgi:hypothetical protein